MHSFDIYQHKSSVSSLKTITFHHLKISMNYRGSWANNSQKIDYKMNSNNGVAYKAGIGSNLCSYYGTENIWEGCINITGSILHLEHEKGVNKQQLKIWCFHVTEFLLMSSNTKILNYTTGHLISYWWVVEIIVILGFLPQNMPRSLNAIWGENNINLTSWLFSKVLVCLLCIFEGGIDFSSMIIWQAFFSSWNQIKLT